METKVNKGLVDVLLRKILVERANPLASITSDTLIYNLDIDSLGIWELLIELEDGIGVEIQEDDLDFREPTVGSLAQQIENQLDKRNLLQETCLDGDCTEK